MRRRLQAAALAVALLGAGYGAGSARLFERPAHAAYQISASDPVWTFQPIELEQQVATFAKTNAITTQAGWTTFVSGLSTTAQAIAVVKGLLTSFHPSAAP